MGNETWLQTAPAHVTWQSGRTCWTASLDDEAVEENGSGNWVQGDASQSGGCIKPLWHGTAMCTQRRLVNMWQKVYLWAMALRRKSRKKERMKVHTDQRVHKYPTSATWVSPWDSDRVLRNEKMISKVTIKKCTAVWWLVQGHKQGRLEKVKKNRCQVHTRWATWLNLPICIHVYYVSNTRFSVDGESELAHCSKQKTINRT